MSLIEKTRLFDQSLRSGGVPESEACYDQDSGDPDDAARAVALIDEVAQEQEHDSKDGRPNDPLAPAGCAGNQQRDDVDDADRSRRDCIKYEDGDRNEDNRNCEQRIADPDVARGG